MANIVPNRQAYAFHHAADLPQEVWHALYKNEPSANVILPFAKKACSFPRGNGREQLWIVLYDGANVEFVLSCTRGQLGNYPVFIVPSKSSAQLAQEESAGRSLTDALLPLVRCLLENVPPQRVFSVFSIARVTEAFAVLFAHTSRQLGHLGIQAYGDPYYDATFTFCTHKTLQKLSDASSHFPESGEIAIALRRADMTHLQEIAAMCKAFSKTSPPFILDDAGAKLEAQLLIMNQQAWVHLAQRPGQMPEIACLIATTRESDNVTAVTKVFTPTHWRGRGCAARLLHRVCEELLQRKKRVVLYVGNSSELAPARKVYHKIGFQGLDGQHVKDVERWLEIGFTGTTLGFW